MFLSKLWLDPHHPNVRRDLANVYDLHRSLLKAFPNQDAGGPGRVLFRVDLDRGESRQPVALVQSQHRPDWSRLSEGFRAAPVKDLDGIAFRQGQRLHLQLRANPTKRLGATSVGRDGKAVDRKWIGRRVGLLREDEQQAWLARKAEEGGFRLLDVRLTPEGTALARKDKLTLTLSAVTFDGTLEVIDAVRFLQTWHAGIGSGKAFGFGLLSLAGA